MNRLMRMLFFASTVLYVHCAGSANEVIKTPDLPSLGNGWYLLEGDRIVRWDFGADGIIQFTNGPSDFATHEARRAMIPCQNWTWGAWTEIQPNSNDGDSHYVKCDRILLRVVIHPTDARERYFGIARESINSVKFLRFVDTEYDGSILYDFPYSSVPEDLEHLKKTVRVENQSFRRILDNYDDSFVDYHDSRLLTQKKLFGATPTPGGSCSKVSLKRVLVQNSLQQYKS